MTKSIIALVVAAFMSPAFAADHEQKNDVTVDHSKNPITGTQTTTKTTKVKNKGDHAKSDMEIKEKTKVMKNGKVEHSKEVDASSSSESH